MMISNIMNASLYRSSDYTEQLLQSIPESESFFQVLLEI